MNVETGFFSLFTLFVNLKKSLLYVQDDYAQSSRLLGLVHLGFDCLITLIILMML